MTRQLTARERLSHKLRDGAYRARILGNSVTLVRVAEVAWWLDDLRCYYCSERLVTIWALEHKTPLAKGGPHNLENICPACMSCNEAKHLLDETEFREWLHVTGRNS